MAFKIIEKEQPKRDLKLPLIITKSSFGEYMITKYNDTFYSVNLSNGRMTVEDYVDLDALVNTHLKEGWRIYDEATLTLDKEI